MNQSVYREDGFWRSILGLVRAWAIVLVVSAGMFVVMVGVYALLGIGR